MTDCEFISPIFADKNDASPHVRKSATAKFIVVAEGVDHDRDMRDHGRFNQSIRIRQEVELGSDSLKHTLYQTPNDLWPFQGLLAPHLYILMSTTNHREFRFTNF